MVKAAGLLAVDFDVQTVGSQARLEHAVRGVVGTGAYNGWLISTNFGLFDTSLGPVEMPKFTLGVTPVTVA